VKVGDKVEGRTTGRIATIVCLEPFTVRFDATGRTHCDDPTVFTMLEPIPPAPAAQDEHATRKSAPLFRGCLAYFPDALLEVAKLSLKATVQHKLKSLYWAFDKSTDHADCIARHQLDWDEEDTDGVLHAVKVAWRALAQLQTLLEKRDAKLHARRSAQRERQKNAP
jgi:hypothetical protein